MSYLFTSKVARKDATPSGWWSMWRGCLIRCLDLMGHSRSAVIVEDFSRVL